MRRQTSANKRRANAEASALRDRIEELVFLVTTGAAEGDDRPLTANESTGLSETSKEALARKALVSEFVSAVLDLSPGSSRREIFRAVSRRLAQIADKADAEESAIATVESLSDGWQQLLTKSLKYKIELLNSRDFTSVTAAGAMLHLSDEAIRRGIRDKKLFALTSPGSDDFRIPLWALDPDIAGATTSQLYRAAAKGRMDSWELFHFMTTPNGCLDGALPYELLLSRETLRPQADLDELLEAEEVPKRTKPIDLVCDALEDEVADRPA